MHFELSLGSEGQRASRTLVGLGGLAVHIGTVLPHVAVGYEAGVAKVTLVGLLSCVCPHVDLHLSKQKCALRLADIPTAFLLHTCAVMHTS